MNAQTKQAYNALRHYRLEHPKNQGTILQGLKYSQGYKIGELLGRNQVFAAEIEISKQLRELGFSNATGFDSTTRTIWYPAILQAILEDLMGSVSSETGCPYCGTAQGRYESSGCCGESSAHFTELYSCASPFSPDDSDITEDMVSNWDTLLNEINKQLAESEAS